MADKILYLRKMDTGRIFAHTDALALRNDMQPIMADPENLDDFEVVSGGDMTDNARMKERIEDLEQEVAWLEAENLRLKEECGEEVELPGTVVGDEVPDDDDEPPVDPFPMGTLVKELHGHMDDLPSLEKELNKQSRDTLEAFGQSLDPVIEVDKRYGVSKAAEALVDHIKETDAVPVEPEVNPDEVPE